jgi:hypothetical protein
MLQKVFVTKRKEVTGDWRQPHNEKHHDLYFSPNFIQIIKSRGIRCEGHVPCIGYKIHPELWYRKPGRKRPIARPRHRWEKIL